ncbi:MAG: tRNA pseudouridine synthase A [Deltaproteobacteria bacterium]|nr:tRNA pseudouridine synthase A [Deltaproteobacteria bacterium]
MSTLLRVAYDGSEFHGFARQRDGPKGPLRTVQGELERAASSLYGESVQMRGASRTDAGVHAQGQLVAFEGPRAIPPRGVARALNGRLPGDIAVVAAWEQAAADGGPIDVRHGNDGKHYRYDIGCTVGRDPMEAGRRWTLGRRLDVAAMQDAAVRFGGTHDFGSFRASHCQAHTTTRTIDTVTLRWGARSMGPPRDEGRLDPLPIDGAVPGRGPDWIEVHVRGRAFLYNMVRIMVGTLVDVGLGRRAPDDITSLLATPDRRNAGPTAPAAGLTLVEVRWPRPSAGTADSG